MTLFAQLTAFLFLVSAYVSNPQLTRAQSRAGETPKSQPVQVAMQNVMYHYTGQATVHILHLTGELIPAKSEAAISFDDKHSFILALTSAEISTDCNVLAQVLNQEVFSSPKAPLKNLSIESKNNRLIVKGKFHQKEDVPFEATGTLSANGDGRIRLHSEHLKAGHLPVKGILDLLGIDLAALINTNKVQGISVDKDDILIDPQQVLPPPYIKGKVTAVRIQGNDIVQVFGAPQGTNFAAKQTGNFIALRSGEVHFAKLTIRDGDVTLIDMDPGDPFDFYLDHLPQQIAAGYAKTTPQFGVRVYARDYSKLHSRRDAAHVANR